MVEFSQLNCDIALLVARAGGHKGEKVRNCPENLYEKWQKYRRFPDRDNGPDPTFFEKTPCDVGTNVERIYLHKLFKRGPGAIHKVAERLSENASLTLGTIVGQGNYNIVIE